MCRCSSSRGFRRPSSGASGSASASSEAATALSGMAVRWSHATRGTLPSLLLLLMVALIGPAMMNALPQTVQFTNPFSIICFNSQIGLSAIAGQNEGNWEAGNGGGDACASA